MDNQTAQIIADYCRENFDLSRIKDAENYGYNTLPLCIIDAVFSINARYSSTRNVVKQFCNHFPVEKQSITALIEAYKIRGVESMAADVYQNRQRTSSTGGILKSEAVLRFAETFLAFNAETPVDALGLIGSAAFENRIYQIPGHRSGISLSYLYMPAGATDMVKPDRMLLRFVKQVTGKNVGAKDCQALVIEASHLLQVDYPELTARALDGAIWKLLSQ